MVTEKIVVSVLGGEKSKLSLLFFIPSLYEE